MLEWVRWRVGNGNKKIVLFVEQKQVFDDYYRYGRYKCLKLDRGFGNVFSEHRLIGTDFVVTFFHDATMRFATLITLVIITGLSYKMDFGTLFTAGMAYTYKVCDQNQ